MRDPLRGPADRGPALDPSLPTSPATKADATKKTSAASLEAPADKFEGVKEKSRDAQEAPSQAPAQKAGFKERISQLWQSLLEALGIRKPATVTASKPLTGLDALHRTLDKTSLHDLYNGSEELEALKAGLKANPLLTDAHFSQLEKSPFDKGAQRQARERALKSLYGTPEGLALKKLVALVKDSENRDSLVSQLGPLLDPGRDANTERGSSLLERLTSPNLRF